ncbi:hypothetical protein [Catellatospora vulcania]|uniref:hypothetical protein n=1 Tax=Catellatospora vulcania TaxID=1460450 RepID=UPI0012D482F6|nr:hypothetical protein [Catellatospora vulcania]
MQLLRGVSVLVVVPVLAACSMLQAPPPITTEALVGEWRAQCNTLDVSPVLSLEADGDFSVADFPTDESDPLVVDGTGEWGLDEIGDHGKFLDLRFHRGDHDESYALLLDYEDDDFKIVHYLGDPDDMNGCWFSR